MISVGLCVHWPAVGSGRYDEDVSSKNHSGEEGQAITPTNADGNADGNAAGNDEGGKAGVAMHREGVTRTGEPPALPCAVMRSKARAGQVAVNDTLT